MARDSCPEGLMTGGVCSKVCTMKTCRSRGLCCVTLEQRATSLSCCLPGLRRSTGFELKSYLDGGLESELGLTEALRQEST